VGRKPTAASNLREAAGRLGRIDRATLVVGQMFNMATEKIITVQTFQSLYNMAGSLFQGLLSVAHAAAASCLTGRSSRPDSLCLNCAYDPSHSVVCSSGQSHDLRSVSKIFDFL
jgi:hypothetical protein